MMLQGKLRSLFVPFGHEKKTEHATGNLSKFYYRDEASNSMEFGSLMSFIYDFLTSNPVCEESLIPSLTSEEISYMVFQFYSK